jgi:hypothetical protein
MAERSNARSFSHRLILFYLTRIFASPFLWGSLGSSLKIESWGHDSLLASDSKKDGHCIARSRGACHARGCYETVYWRTI